MGSFEVAAAAAARGLPEYRLPTRLRHLGQGVSDEVEQESSSLDLGSSSEKPPSFDYAHSRGPSLEVGSSLERGPSFEVGSSIERGSSYEDGSSVDRGPSFEVESSVERGSSFEVGSSVERGPSFDTEYTTRNYESLRQEGRSTEILESRKHEEVSIQITGVDDLSPGFLPVGATYDLAASMELGDSFEDDRRQMTHGGSDQQLRGLARGAPELAGPAAEALASGGASLETEEVPLPPPRVPRRGGRSPAAAPGTITRLCCVVDW